MQNDLKSRSSRYLQESLDIINSNRKIVLSFVLITAIPLGVKLYWQKLNGGNTTYDDSGYTHLSLLLYDALHDHGVRAFCDQYMTPSIKGPMMALQAVPFYMVFGRSIESVELINTVLIVVFSVYLYLFCCLFWSPGVGLIAVLTTSMCPLVYNWCNQYLREYELAALVTATAYHLYRSEGFRRLGHSMILGVLMGIGVLLKITYLVYVLPLFVIAFSSHVWTKVRAGAFKSTWISMSLGIGTVLVTALVVAGPWYVKNFSEVFDYSFNAGYGSLGYQAVGDKNVFSWKVIGPYLSSIAFDGFSPWHLGLAVVCIALCWWANHKKRLAFSELFPPGATLALLGWALPFGVFLFGVNKIPRFVVPIMPTFSIPLAALMWGASRAFSKAKILLVVLYVPAVLLCFYTLFGPETPLNSVEEFISSNFVSSGVARPERLRWPHPQVLQFIEARGSSLGGKTLTICMVTDTRYFNQDRLRLIAVLNRIPMNIQSAVYEVDPSKLRPWASRADFFVGQKGQLQHASRFSEKSAAMQTVDTLVAEGEFVVVECPIDLPDGTQVGLWKRVQ